MYVKHELLKCEVSLIGGSLIWRLCSAKWVAQKCHKKQQYDEK